MCSQYDQLSSCSVRDIGVYDITNHMSNFSRLCTPIKESLGTRLSIISTMSCQIPMQGQNLEVQLIDTCMTGINSLHQDCHQITSNTCTKDTYSPEAPWANVPFFQALEKLKYFIFLVTFFMIGHLHYMQLTSYSFFFEQHNTSNSFQHACSVLDMCLWDFVTCTVHEYHLPGNKANTTC